MIYNGVALGAKSFPGNMSVNMIILYLMEMISYFVSGALIEVKFLGRKRTCIISYCISAACILILTLKIFSHETVILIINCIIRFFLSAIINVFYVYNLEVYPTPVRSLGFGINNFFGYILAFDFTFFFHFINAFLL